MSNFPNVDAYEALDLSLGSEVGQELLDEAQIRRELDAGAVMLSDVQGQIPANLTPHMQSWYQNRVAPLRSAALDEINNALKAFGDEETVSAPLVERSIDQINDEQINDKRSKQEQHSQRNTGSYNKLDELKSEYLRAKRGYDERFKKRRREPKMIGWFYWALIGFIGVFEAFINFEAFAALSLFTPFVALGSTVVIAILLALASHLHGAFLAQVQHRFGPHRSDGDVWAAWRVFGLGTLGLTIVLSAVWYARANFLRDAIIEASVIGGEAPSWLATVGGSLLMNLGVWVAGVIVSFLCHDSDPDYPGLKKARDTKSKAFRKLEDKLNSQLEKEFRRIDAVAENKREDAKAFDDAMRENGNYVEARKQFERINAKDASVLGLLKKYQTDFASSAGVASLPISYKDELRSEVELQMSASEYGALAITLKYT